MTDWIKMDVRRRSATGSSHLRRLAGRILGPGTPGAATTTTSCCGLDSLPQRRGEKPFLHMVRLLAQAHSLQQEGQADVQEYMASRHRRFRP